MTEVFITNIENQNQADIVAKTIRSIYSDLKINTDLSEDFYFKYFPVFGIAREYRSASI